MNSQNQSLRSKNIMNATKRIITLAALFITVLTTSSFANNIEEANGAIKAAFRNDFQNGRIINTEVRKTFTKLTFTMNNIVLFAFYSDNGQLLAVTRNILSSQLPIGLQMNLKKDYGSFWISELFELNGEGQNTYYMTVENADVKITLRSDGNDNWEVYEKTSK